MFIVARYVCIDFNIFYGAVKPSYENVELGCYRLMF